MENMMNVINQIQEQTRVNRIKAAHELYKQIKEEIIQQLLIKLEREIISAMMEGMSYTNVSLTKIEASHGEELKEYFTAKGFNAYCDRMYRGDDTVEYFIFIEWASKELNLQ